MWRPFMTVPNTIVGSITTETVRIGRRFSPLPTRVIDRVFDELDILDRCCLALCNKALLKHAVLYEHLDYVVDSPPSRKDLQLFFEQRLGQGWVGHQLRYCSCCGTFASTVSFTWRLISEKLTRERSGMTADLWRSRRDDGWLRYWIERWCADVLDVGDAAASLVRRKDKTKLLCPKCAIQDPESNAWRRQISGSKECG